jgi:hypothetical protein
MTLRRPFEHLASLIPAELELKHRSVGCCILAKGIAIEVADYFAIPAAPLAVRMVIYNRAFAKHLEEDDTPPG